MTIEIQQENTVKRTKTIEGDAFRIKLTILQNPSPEYIIPIKDGYLYIDTSQTTLSVERSDRMPYQLNDEIRSVEPCPRDEAIEAYKAVMKQLRVRF